MRVRAILLAVLVLALFPVAAEADYPHVVQPGETLTSVAAVDGLSIESIAAANRISPQAQLVAGQTLWIPPRTAANSAVGTGTSASSGTTATGSQTTTTSSQASTTARTVAGSVATSGSDPDGDGDVDASAATTTGSTSSESSTSQSSTSQTSGSQAATASSAAVAGGPVPTLERVSGAEITAVANANGVPPALAEAVAWQESGWNNDVVSNVGAVGVMQIVPSTWLWIDRYLTPSSPLGTASAVENIRAGVLLLRQLLQLTGGDEQLAVAGYYQGLQSVRRYGMYPSTKQYVADVLALAQRL
jgi:soluble lytic murein transglycosylase-like protein